MPLERAADGSLGEDHSPEIHLIPLVIQVALGQRDNIKVFGTDYPTPDGTCVRDYIHVDDLAEAHLLALERIEPGRKEAFNVGTGCGTSVLEVIEAVRVVTWSRNPRPRSPTAALAIRRKLYANSGPAPNSGSTGNPAIARSDQ